MFRLSRTHGSTWSARVSLAVMLAFAALVLGCDGHLVGTRDIVLEYRATGPAADGDLAELALERIHAGDLAADVRIEGSSRLLRVTADEGAAEEVDPLLMWSGGLSLYVVDPGFSMEPKHASEGGTGGPALTRETEVSTSGAALAYFVGTPSAVARVARLTPPEGGHRLVSDVTAGPLARTRSVFDPPLADLTFGVEAADAHGSDLEVRLTESGRATLARASATRAGRAVAFVRDATILAVAPITLGASPGTLTISLGSAPRAYARAEVAARLLATRSLPRLTRTAATHAPPSFTLGVAGLLLPIVMSLAWLAFVRRFDRARPEPLWLVLLTFALGGAAVIPASFAEWSLGEASPYTNPQLMTFGGQLWALPLGIAAFTLTVGLLEEGAKLAAAWVVARHRREFDEPVDGIVYAAASALGFAALESVRYLAAGRVAPTLVVTRAFMSAPAHFLFSALWGYALGQRLVDPRRTILPLFLLAALAHGTFDALLSFPATAALAPLVNFGLASAFVVMLRRALRHGPIDARAPAPGRGREDVFPIGSRSLFALSVLAMHASAALVFALGVWVEQTHARVGPLFVLGATLLLALLGVTAHGVAATLPLDVVLDDAGVTFGGAFVAWADVSSVERRGGPGRAAREHRIVLTGPGQPLTLGPMAPGAVDHLVSALRARMARPAATS